MSEFVSPEPLVLESGFALPGFTLAYEVYGEWNPSRAILVCHALSGSAQAVQWWKTMVGPGLPLDTSRWCIVSSNVLGGCGGSTGPSSLHADGRPWARRFPVLTVPDMVAAQVRLADHLGVSSWEAVVGGCLGGAQALTWLQRHPSRLRKAVGIGITARTSPHTLAFYEVLRQALTLDPAYGDGDYYASGEFPTAGMALNARVGMLFWMTPAFMEARYARRTLAEDYRYTLEPEFAIHEAMAALGQGLGHKFDPNTMIYLTRAMDYYDLSRGYPDLATAMAHVTHPVQLVSYRTDWRYPPESMERLREAIPGARHTTLESQLGHGAWLFETGSLGEVVREFMG